MLCTEKRYIMEAQKVIPFIYLRKDFASLQELYTNSTTTHPKLSPDYFPHFHLYYIKDKRAISPTKLYSLD